jgi:hypothetical protein
MTIRFKSLTIVLFFLVGFLVCSPLKSNCQNFSVLPVSWVELEKGLMFCEIEAPEKSIVNDSKLTILKIDPSKFEFNLLTSTEFGKKARPATLWAEEFKMEIIVNAGMYSFTKGQPNKGYLKNYDHVNNPRMNGYYNAMMVLHPKDSTKLPFSIYDITCTSWDSIKTNYYSFCQGMRMLDCNGNPLAWDKNPTQSCSMLLTSTDMEGNIYFIFSRSPYTHQTMIKFLKELPFNLQQTIYLEGGPEASLYINTGKDTISKFGSYISKTWANDDNDHFWEIPNVIGIRKKK